MDINKFYRTYLNENELARVAMRGDQNHNSVKKLAEQRAADLENPDYIASIVDGMEKAEQELIRKLNKTDAHDGHHTVPYRTVEYPQLIDKQIILEAKNKEGVIHVKAVHEIYQEMDKRTDQGKLWGGNLSALDRSVLQNLAQYNFYYLLGGLGIKELKQIAKNLGYSPPASFKNNYVEGLMELLTDPDALTRILTVVEEDEYRKLMDHVNKDLPFFKMSQGGKSLINLGIVMPTFSEYGIIPEEIMEAVHSINHTELKARRRSYQNDESIGANIEDYSALRLKLTLVGSHIPITREVVMPARLNFYELHVVIQEAMGWQMSHLASFSNSLHEIFVYSFDESQDFMEEDYRLKHLASYTQVDTILTQTGEMSYIYDYGDHWEHRIELLEYMQNTPEAPCVTDHEGPGPIEDSGGVDGFERMYAIIKDKSHPEYGETINWAKSLNYKGRYPKKAINRALEAMFRKKRPLTEFNDPLIND